MSGFSLSTIKNTFDEVRSQYYPKNETEKKVYEALSGFKNWGASSTQLNDLAAESMDYEKYKIMTNIIWQFLETDGRTWKQIFKNLTLIEFLIKNGSERFIEDCRDKLYRIRSLQDFNFYEGSIEKASGIREKAKQIVELLGSNDLIRTERDKARQLRNKFVGIDSRNAGYSGGGSNSYYGGGNSYSGGGNSYSEGGSGGRYDSYDSGNNQGNNRRASTNSDFNTGRYGGGAYDSERPPRYGDEGNDDRRAFREEQRNEPHTRYEEEHHDEKPKPHKSKSISGPVASTSTGGKLKVNIKAKSGDSHSKPAAERNLLDTGDIDLMGGPVNSGTVPNDSFDAFDSAPAFSSAGASDFDPFGTSAPAQPAITSAAAFDPFGNSHPAPAAPAQNNAFPFNAPAPAAPFQQPPMNAFPPNNAFPPANNAFPPSFPPQQQNNFNAFPPQNNFVQPAPAPMNAFNNGFGQAPAMQPVAQPPAQSFASPASKPAGNLGTFSHDAEFGDFEGPAQTQQATRGVPAAQPAPDKWGDLGSLVNLSKIEKNADLNAKQAAATANTQNFNNSFAGLDGFSKTPQSMASSSAARPLGSYGSNQGAPRPPMNTGLAPNYPPMGGAPMMNPGMGMGMGAPMGAPMGGPMGGAPPMNYNAYPNNAYPPRGPAPMGGPYMGNPAMGNPAMGGMGMPGMYNAPPGGNPNYGANQGFGMPPRGW